MGTEERYLHVILTVCSRHYDKAVNTVTRKISRSDTSKISPGTDLFKGRHFIGEVSSGSIIHVFPKRSPLSLSGTGHLGQQEAGAWKIETWNNRDSTLLPSFFCLL